MDSKQLIEKVREKREFSQLPEIDIETAYSHFSKRQVSEDEKIKLTQEFLRKLFSAFVSKKLLSLKDKESEWILRKHISTRERLSHYEEIYRRIFGNLKKASVIDLVPRRFEQSSNANRLSVVDLGAGINGFSYSFFEKLGIKVDYTAIESVGQLVELMNYYFKEKKVQGRAIHFSLLELEKVKKIISDMKKPRIVFLFKVIDALENLKPNYSKELISEITPLADKVVVSFATKSLGSRERFKAKKNWILNFTRENFNVLDNFEIGGERYLVFNK